MINRLRTEILILRFFTAPGAVQIYEVKSRGSLDRSRATFPEILETSAEFGAAQSDDGVGA